MARVYTEVVWNMQTGEMVSEQWYDWTGEVALCKGADEANAQRKKELALQQEAWDRQKQQMDLINKNFEKFLSGDVGFDPKMLAMLNSQALDQNATNFSDASQGIRQALASRGVGLGDAPVGGEFVRGLSGLYGAQASDKANALRTIGLANLQQALTNKFNAGSLMSGNAAALNSPISSFTGGASSALDSYIKAANSGFGAAFTQALGGSLGKGLGSLATSGLSGMMNRIPGANGMFNSQQG